MAYPYSSYKAILDEKCFYIEKEADMEKVFQKVSQENTILETMKNGAFDVAQNELDYIKLARRILQ